MKLTFEIEDIKYLKLDVINNSHPDTIRLSLKEKRENDFIAMSISDDNYSIETPQKVNVAFICKDGLYKTTTTLIDTYKNGDITYFVISIPDTLDFQQNREYYRMLAEYDCIYTVDTGYDIESFNATTYDISPGGVSIITSENIIPTRETSIIIFMQERDLKTHIKFARCETTDDKYKFSFAFTDLCDSDFEFLSKLCADNKTKTF